VSDDPDEIHARNVLRHGRARADQARWQALGLLALRVYEMAGKRREEALHDLLDASLRVHAAAEDERRWSRIVDWTARRLDACDAMRAKKSRMHIEGLRPTDLETEDIEW
jgi:hypothetical protein